ncbi:hypothetical protein SAMN04488051_11533 [Alkalimonas amylolytica]|uniref:Uncharacterized protein n=1 Tax=Alkalimonas amylolytica TaxID=152573 RepID=A0A1H4G303_ALKAM|nr:hypothetical protein SAMN04488051_11533 [Alkalimonas amylolytica]
MPNQALNIVGVVIAAASKLDGIGQTLGKEFRVRTKFTSLMVCFCISRLVYAQVLLFSALSAKYRVNIHALMKNADDPYLLAACLLIKNQVATLRKFSVTW